MHSKVNKNPKQKIKIGIVAGEKSGDELGSSLMHSLKKIFRPGFTTKSRGWGLGLSLAKRIVHDYHQGFIQLKESKLGQGTTFEIMLPKA